MGKYLKIKKNVKSNNIKARKTQLKVLNRNKV